jgi:hypothetical protein
MASEHYKIQRKCEDIKSVKEDIQPTLVKWNKSIEYEKISMPQLGTLGGFNLIV